MLKIYSEKCLTETRITFKMNQVSSTHKLQEEMKKNGGETFGLSIILCKSYLAPDLD